MILSPNLVMWMPEIFSLQPVQRCHSWNLGSFLEIKQSPNAREAARPGVSYCPHVRACNPNLHEFNQKGIRVLWWAVPPQHAAQPPSNLWMASLWFPEAGDGECLRYLEMRKVSGHVMIHWHRQPSSRVKTVPLIWLLVVILCIQIMGSERETLNFQNITSSGRKLDQLCLTEIKFLIHSI